MKLRAIQSFKSIEDFDVKSALPMDQAKIDWSRSLFEYTFLVLRRLISAALILLFRTVFNFLRLISARFTSFQLVSAKKSLFSGVSVTASVP